jgi:hypothetical protein
MTSTIIGVLIGGIIGVAIAIFVIGFLRWRYSLGNLDFMDDWDEK